MPTFAYTARDASGNPVSGTVNAPSAAQAIQDLRAEGRFPTSVGPTGGERLAPGPVARGIRISRAEVIQLSTQLAIMIDTGVTLSEALDCIARQADRPPVRRLVNEMALQIQNGGSFSEALARHPRSFPRLYISLIRASEKTGMMARMLLRATAYLKSEQETRRRVKGALTYPAIMAGFATVTTAFLLTFVLPRFTVIYANKKAALPAPTQVLMAISGFMVNHWAALLAAIVGAVVALSLVLRTRGGRRAWHSLQLHVPLLGKMYRRLHLARGLRMVGTMAGAGVSLLDCVRTAHDLCENSHFRDLWDRVRVQIEAGRPFSEPLFESALVPRSVAQMIFSGEKSGKLASVMEQLAGYSEEELKEQIAALTRYIEPTMIAVMGLIVGGVAMAMLLPIFSLSKVLAH